MGENAVSFKRLYVKQADLDAFGYTPDCIRCKHAMKYGPGRTNTPHSEPCRMRIAEALRGTEAGRKRLAAFETRTNQQLATEIQRSTELQMDAPAAQGRLFVMDRQRHPVQRHPLH